MTAHMWSAGFTPAFVHSSENTLVLVAVSAVDPDLEITTIRVSLISIKLNSWENESESVFATK